MQAKLTKKELANAKMSQENERMLQEINDKQRRIEEFNDRKQNAYYFYKKYLHNKLQELKGNIRVFCRLRPVVEGQDDPSDLIFSEGIDKVVRTPNFQSIEISHMPGGKQMTSGKNPYQ